VTRIGAGYIVITVHAMNERNPQGTFFCAYFLLDNEAGEA